jgi:diadenylate cyclase
VGEQDAKAGWTKFINALVEETSALSRQKIGALIVIEQNTKLGEIIKTGTIIDSDPSAELIGIIFFPNSPLQDGAMIVRNGRLHAAAVFLPHPIIPRSAGARHPPSCALGM